MGDVRPIEQLLLLIAYVRRHDGARVTDVARAIGVEPAEVPALVDRLLLCGKPPFSPEDLIEAWIEHPDRVRVHLDQSLGRPLQLTPAEALALSIALRAVATSSAEPYAAQAASALARLKATLSPRTSAEVAGVEARIAIDAGDHGASGDRFAVLSRGLSERRAVDISYYSAGKGELSQRRLRPYALLQHQSAWYVIGHDGLHGDVRIFRVDRVRDAELTDERFEPPADFDATRYRVGQKGEPRGVATVRIHPRMAQQVVEEREGAELSPDGSALLSLEFYETQWLAAWVMSLGGAAEVVAPPELRQAVLERCREALAAEPSSD